MKVKVFAKLNLSLLVGEKVGDYHLVDSVATSVNIYDVVEVTERNDCEITVNCMPQVATQDNSAYKAAKAFQTCFSTNGVSISVQKGIPFGGGLGGSSADAAAVVYCMCKLFNVDVCSQDVHEICAKLGSDVNFMLFGGLGRLQGKGDDVTYYKMAQPLCFALTTFDVGISSGASYSAFDRLRVANNSAQSVSKVACAQSELDTERTDELLRLLCQGENGKAIALFLNDLQQATSSVSGYANNYLSITSLHGLTCNMTGSGSTYFVACESLAEAQRVTDLLNANGFTTTVCKSVPKGIVEFNTPSRN